VSAAIPTDAVAPEVPPEISAPEIYGARAIWRIVGLLPPIERAYSFARFLIMRPKLLSAMDLLLPAEGRILDLGCGFGLFAAYFGQTQPAREIVGIDLNPKRVAMAQAVATGLGLGNHRFVVGDVRQLDLAGTFAGAYVLDVMHHVPADSQRAILKQIYDLLTPGGVLVMKDITTASPFGLQFTKVLDRMMVGLSEPLAYRHHREWAGLLMEIGFSVRVARVPDILPYPHVILAAQKPTGESRR
jgi:SAM-dependent methyltransferase